MIFNSIPFVLFFVSFFLLYWFVFSKSLKLQNLFLLAGCYFFYAWWDWRFLLLMIAYSSFNYKLGYYINKSRSQKTKHYLTLLGSFVGLGLLVYFKYTNFFITSFVSAFAHYKVNFNIQLLNIALPLGISFYTFRTLSYLYDIRNNKFKPTDDWIVFFSFVAFFPCLLAGPIDRPKTLIPQLEKKRAFEYEKGSDALRQILWGLFKKLAIADNLSVVTNKLFDHYSNVHGSAFVLGTFYYSIQIYADFSGYSDMAIGFARLLGFEVTKNFNFPFFSQSIAEFWRKWHISLTSWLTEYVFTPLSIKFRDFGNWGLIMAIIINLTLIGMWHGANLTYMLFGLLHGIYFIPLILNGTMNKKKSIDPNKLLPNFIELIKMIQTFILVNFAFIIFRANNMSEVFFIIKQIFSNSLLAYPTGAPLRFIPLIFVFLIAEWLQRGKQYTLQISGLNPYLRIGVYYALFFATIIFSSSQVTQFIYLKF
jgi:alginate O-acetyltransferase complex protein AlgI